MLISPRPTWLYFLILPSFFFSHCVALRFTLQGRSHESSVRAIARALDSPTHYEQSLSRRGVLLGHSNLTNRNDISYYADIRLNGRTIHAMIDSGSSDLWVSGPISNSVEINNGEEVAIKYAVGEASGPIKVAVMEFAGYTIQNQAYIDVNTTVGPEGTGLLGIGPSSGSVVKSVVPPPTGNTVLGNIFSASESDSVARFMTILLGRTPDHTRSYYPGEMTIGELLPGYEAIVDQPKLGITEIQDSKRKMGQHVQVLLDKDGFTAPDGVAISTSSLLSSSSEPDRLTVIFDTGFTLPQVPPHVAEEIYSSLPGAQLTKLRGIGYVWAVSCQQEVNVSLSLGGQVIRMHPLDVTIDPTKFNFGLEMEKNGIKDANGNKACVGTLQPFSFKKGNDPTYDAILGMSFLRNTYMLVNYGDLVNENGTSSISENATTTEPYIQLLPLTTDAARAHTEFVNVRLGGIDTTVPIVQGSFHHREGPKPVGSGRGVVHDAKVSGIIAGCIGAGAVATFVGILGLMMWKRKGKRAQIPAPERTRTIESSTNNDMGTVADAVSAPGSGTPMTDAKELLPPLAHLRPGASGTSSGSSSHNSHLGDATHTTTTSSSQTLHEVEHQPESVTDSPPILPELEIPTLSPPLPSVHAGS